ncbi:MAG: hypothetical protein MI924_22230 [Chloroflexales bacterium]|nr:hypothetical protein [Chloroflexales bacterium]
MPTSQGGPRPQTPPTRVRPRISLPAQSTLIRGSAAAIATAIAVASDGAGSLNNSTFYIVEEEQCQLRKYLSFAGAAQREHVAL